MLGGVRPTRVLDLHQDLLPHVRATGAWLGPPGQTGWAQLEASAVRALVATTFPLRAEGERLAEPAMPDRIEALLREYGELAATRPGWRLVLGAGDLDAVLSPGATERGLLVGIEGLGSLTLADAERLERWHGLGWRCLGPVWNEPGPLAGGTYDADTGLSDEGAELLRWARERDMVVDLAHMSERSFWDAADVLDGPLLVSHANARALCEHPRNLTDAQLDAVAESGGVVGVVLLGRFVTPEGAGAGAPEVARHVEHMCARIGPEHVALGTDFGGLGTGAIAGLESLSRLDALWDTLSARGLGAEVLEQVAWRSAQRVLAALLGP